MLKILDRYIIRKFLTTFFFMLGVIMLLSMVFDLSERLSEFNKQNKFGEHYFNVPYEYMTKLLKENIQVI